jgi:hypothetical protein
MIKSLRKRHLQIWTLWALLLPIGIITAWLAVLKPVTDKLLQPEASTALPVLQKSIDKKNYTVNLKSNEDKSQYQLEWINKETLSIPSSLIYKASPNPASPLSSPKESEKEGGDLEGAELVGRIETRGTYHFNLLKDSTNNYNFILYDIIKKQIIDSLNFSAAGGVR